MKFIMHKKKQYLTLVITMICTLAFLTAILLSIKEYSFSIGLFDDFDIQISGNNYVDIDQIENQIYPHLSSSLLSINLKNIQDEILFLDYIETAQISKVFPLTLMIHVVERVPAVLINWDDEPKFLDRNGILMPADNKAITIFPVPVLTIIEEDECKDISTRHIAQFFKYLLTEYPFFYDNLSEVIIGEEEWTFYSDSKTQIFAKSENLFTQLNILKNFEKTVYPNRRLDDYSYIDLRIHEQIVVKEKYRKG